MSGSGTPPSRSIGLPQYADSECNDNDDGRGSLLLLSDNEEGLLRLSLSNGAIGRSTRSFWSSAENCVRLHHDVIQRLGS